MGETTVLRGGRVIDPALGINKIADVQIRDGKIAVVGDVADTPDANVIDVSGQVVTPGWVDLHLHAYGDLGFAYPDYITIYQGVTSCVEAGGPGLGTLAEYRALFDDALVADLYCGVYVRPMGIINITWIEGDVRTLGNWDLAAWIDIVEANRDILKYVKMGAFGDHDIGPLRMGKGLAEILELPTYTHIGDYQVKPRRDTTKPAFEVAERGDMITHIYHDNPGRIFGDDGKLRPEVRAAQQRGVLFDIGFGQTNFAFDIAERGMAEGIMAHTISSDLQQYNVLGPVFSFANTMSCMLAVGMSLEDVIEACTIAPARALSIDDRAGSLAVGMPADVTVCDVENGDFEYVDCFQQTRTGQQQIVPVMALKNGKRYDSDLELARDERNWLPIVREDAAPDAAANLDPQQKAFLRALIPPLNNTDWDPAKVDLDVATHVQNLFRRVQAEQGLPLKDALLATYQCFWDEPFTHQIGLFMTRLDRDFAVKRFHEVADLPLAAAG